MKLFFLEQNLSFVAQQITKFPYFLPHIVVDSFVLTDYDLYCLFNVSFPVLWEKKKKQIERQSLFFTSFSVQRHHDLKVELHFFHCHLLLVCLQNSSPWDSSLSAPKRQWAERGNKVWFLHFSAWLVYSQAQSSCNEVASYY